MPGHKGTILRPDDMHRGQNVTVLNPPDYATSYTVGDYETTQRVIDNSLCGVPLQILAVNLPYVSVANLNGPGRRVIDVRETDLMRVSIEYVESLLPSPPKQQSNGDCQCASCVALRKLQEDLKGCAGN